MKDMFSKVMDPKVYDDIRKAALAVVRAATDHERDDRLLTLESATSKIPSQSAAIRHILKAIWMVCSGECEEYVIEHLVRALATCDTLVDGEVANKARTLAVGSIVLYRHGDLVSPAIVSSVDDEETGRVSLTIFKSTGIMYDGGSFPGDKDGQWHWPPEKEGSRASVWDCFDPVP